ncbi:DUF262 domain-containing protein [Arthrobacter sp. B1805]|uniref:DUF262 domain-containing protein n=1 Tax=Arthrobacter sp. B1805 TaxID=2058892 RepID=UPI000CE33B4C|nr:DUF262 domain-containing protein [Arthrobacter sp. B1805]
MSHVRGLEAAPVTLSERLGDDVQLYCPLFQRRYVWGKKEIDQLWSDIDTVIDEQYTRRFLGALVFDDERAPTAREAGQYWVIDGQQRLTTMVLTIVALAQHAQTFGPIGLELARDLYGQYLVSRKRETKNHPKLRPTLRDTRQFNNILRGAFENPFELHLDVEREAGEDAGDMTKAFKIILRHIEQRTLYSEDGLPLPPSVSVDRLEKLREVLLDQLEFVEIRLGEAHDPNEVFDRLNNEGVRLGIIDLVRNEVLKRLKDNANTALRLYSEQWKPFEDAFADNPAKTGYFFPFALTIDSTVTKATTFKALTSRWSDLTSDGDLSGKQQLLEIMSDLRRHQSAYNAIHSGRLAGLDLELQEFVRRLVDLNRPASCYPYIMQLLTATSAGEVDIPDATKCLRIVESFLVRRAFLGIEPTGLHAIFKRLWRDAGADAREVRKQVVSSTVTFPNDAMFAQGIRTGNLYGRRICKYVLAEYERSSTRGDIMVRLPDITIDHLMPQDYAGSWTEAFTREEHDMLANTWANLVPLSQPANSSKNNRDWSAVRDHLRVETVFSTTKRVYAENDDWTPEALYARAVELEAWALARWPYFNELTAG